MPRSPIFALPRRPLALWLALLIAVFGALAPTVSRALALARSQAPTLLEICTSSGPRWTTRAALESPADTQERPDAAQPLLHCPFCLLQADPVAPAPPFSPHFLRLPVFLEKPARQSAFFFLARFALAPPPRGPPA
jgi:hypothetical protein